MRYGHNSTIGVKQKICTSCGKPSFWFSKKRCADCSRIEDTAKRMEKETNRVIQHEDLSGLIEDADILFSQFIRLKYSNKEGVTGCYTCYERKHWTLMQNGHYVKRSHLYLRWDERNCRPQCQHCNEYLHGNMAEYSKRLDAECHGLPDILRAESVLVHKPAREEIREIISEYTPKVKALKQNIK